MGINIAKCRGQTYDNAFNMSGLFNGVRAHIEAVNALATYIPCAAHSLNLVGSSAANCCSAVRFFFDFVQKLYSFFSSSTQRWGLLRKHFPSSIPVPKQLSDTRWARRVDATHALRMGYAGIRSVLEEMGKLSAQSTRTAATSEALGLLNALNQLETAILTVVWDTVLQRFGCTSKKLQSPTLDIDNACLLTKCLKEWVTSLRNRFSDFEAESKSLLLSGTGYKRDQQRKRSLKVAIDKNPSSQTVCNGRENFRIDVFTILIDRLESDLELRYNAYKNTCDTFGVLGQLHDGTDEEHMAGGKKLVELYKEDLEPLFVDGLVNFPV